MTREEILEQAKVGGYAVVRLPIVNTGGLHADVQRLGVLFGNHEVNACAVSVVSIEPPQTDAEKLVDALAEIERLNIIVKKYDAATLSYSTAFAGSEAGKCLASLHWNMRKHNAHVADNSNHWRDHDGGDMPCTARN